LGHIYCCSEHKVLNTDSAAGFRRILPLIPWDS